MREIGVGLLGLGNVGAGVVKLLEDNAEAIEARLGARVVVRAIGVRDTERERLVEVDRSLLTTDLDAVIDRDDVEIVCELIGGDTHARTAVLRAIERKKHVVTANKFLLAMHGEEVFAAAEKAGADVYYEAAVCGGVPIIRMLREGLASDRIHEIYGIVNGTSNFILSTMETEGRPFAEILAEAQERGYAEADPTLDINGGDASHKLAILIMLCFGAWVDADAIYKEGIDGLAPIDFVYAKRFGYVIKPLAIAKEIDGVVEARVHPAMVPETWLLGDVPGAKNALYVNSYALGASMYYGAGAGMMPTAMAAVSDLIEVGRNICADAAGHLPMRSYQALTHRPLRSIDERHGRYYMRFSVSDRPGVFGRITSILGAHEISIAQVVQEDRLRRRRDDAAPDLDAGGEPVWVVVLSHAAREGDVRRALAEIAELDAVVEPAAVVRIEQSRG